MNTMTPDEAKQKFDKRIQELSVQSRFEPFKIVPQGRYVIYHPAKDRIYVHDLSWDRLHHFDMRSDHLSWLGVETRWGFIDAKQRMVAPDREVGMMLARRLHKRVYDKIAEAKTSDLQTNL